MPSDRSLVLVLAATISQGWRRRRCRRTSLVGALLADAIPKRLPEDSRVQEGKPALAQTEGMPTGYRRRVIISESGSTATWPPVPVPLSAISFGSRARFRAST